MPNSLKALTILASLLATQSFAQTPSDMAAARSQYKREIAACAVAMPVESRGNCVKEARNTLAEIKRGRMNETRQAADYEKNGLLRCEAHQGEDKSDCMARIGGQGKIEGSVAGGGILRELTTTKIIPVAVTAVQAPAPKAPDGPRPSGLMSNCKWVPPIDWVCK